jgi:hypothetical protein
VRISNPPNSPKQPLVETIEALFPEPPVAPDLLRDRWLAHVEGLAAERIAHRAAERIAALG